MRWQSLTCRVPFEGPQGSAMWNTRSSTLGTHEELPQTALQGGPCTARRLRTHPQVV